MMDEDRDQAERISPPALDPVRSDAEDPIFLGQPLRKTVRQLLIVEVVLLCIASVILDGGVMLRAVGVASLLGWLALLGGLLRRRIRPRSADIVEIAIGIVLSVGAPIILLI